MTRLPTALALLAVCGCAGNAPVPTPPPRTAPTSLEAAFVAANFVPIEAVSALPLEMRPLIVPWPMPIAEPGQDYNFTDVVEEGVPAYRLIVGGRTADIGFVLFDAGGYYGPHQQLVLVQFSGDHVTAFCRFIVVGRARSVGDAKAAVPSALRQLSGYGCR